CQRQSAQRMPACTFAGHARGLTATSGQCFAMLIPMVVVPERLGARAQVIEAMTRPAAGVALELVQCAHQVVNFALDLVTSGDFAAETGHENPPLDGYLLVGQPARLKVRRFSSTLLRHKPVWGGFSVYCAPRDTAYFATSLVLVLKLRHSIFGLLLACSSVIVSPASFAAPAQQELASGSALLVDLNTNQVLYSSNPDLVVPIASVTKLMTAMVVLDAQLPLDEQLPITIRDAAEMQGVFSRVRIGSEI